MRKLHQSISHIAVHICQSQVFYHLTVKNCTENIPMFDGLNANNQPNKQIDQF